MFLSVVTPALNEAEPVPPIIPRLREALRGMTRECIFIDDGSTGAASRIAEPYPLSAIAASDSGHSDASAEDESSYSPLAGTRA